MARVFEPDGVFQFTPLREGRRALRQNRYVLPHFNSRPSARGDGSLDCQAARLLDISIHAPPRGATCAS